MPADRPALRWATALIAVALLAVACSSSPDVVIDGAGELGGTPAASAVPEVTATPTPEPPAPEATEPPTVDSSPWPAARPGEFAFEFGQDGGSAPWSEDIGVEGDRGTYVLWFEGIEYVLDYTPSAERLDGLYREVAQGRFDLYEVVPFADDEIIYDAEGESWVASVDGFRHRIGINGESIDRPDASGSPLSAMSSFNDRSRVPDATVALQIVLDDSTEDVDLWGLELHVALGGADLAVGDDRWTHDLMLWVTEPIESAAVRLLRRYGQDETVYHEGTVSFGNADTLLISAAPDGDLSVTVG
ncbi:MAG: hypothetical protein AAF567_00225 [Actinomycetota bacterium]